MSLEDILLKV